MDVEHRGRGHPFGVAQAVLPGAALVPGGDQHIPGLHPDLVEVHPQLGDDVGRGLAFTESGDDLQGRGAVGAGIQERVGRKSEGERFGGGHRAPFQVRLVDVEHGPQLRAALRDLMLPGIVATEIERIRSTAHRCPESGHDRQSSQPAPNTKRGIAAHCCTVKVSR
jgi:hypothetical protein